MRQTITSSSKRWPWFIFILVAAVLHSSSSVAALPKEITPHYLRMLKYHQAIDGNVPPGSYIFIGDSTIQGLCVEAVISPAINYGIGRDTTVGVLGRLQYYHSLTSAKAVILAIGVNDLFYRTVDEIVNNYKLILQQIPPNVARIVCGVNPIDENVFSNNLVTNKNISSLNNRLAALCESTKYHCQYLDITSIIIDSEGNLQNSLHQGDGIHFNTKGNQIWIDSLTREVARISTP